MLSDKTRSTNVSLTFIRWTKFWCVYEQLSMTWTRRSDAFTHALKPHSSWASEENKTKATLVAEEPIVYPPTRLLRKFMMDAQLPHVVSRMKLKFGSVSQMLPEPSSTITKSIASPQETKNFNETASLAIICSQSQRNSRASIRIHKRNSQR